MIIRQVLAAVEPLEGLYTPGKALGGSSATISNLLSPLIFNFFLISGLLAFLVIIFAGFNYITAAGDKSKIEQSQNMINYGILGLVLVVTSFLVTRVIGAVFGFKFF